MLVEDCLCSVLFSPLLVLLLLIFFGKLEILSPLFDLLSPLLDFLSPLRDLFSPLTDRLPLLLDLFSPL